MHLKGTAWRERRQIAGHSGNDDAVCVSIVSSPVQWELLALPCNKGVPARTVECHLKRLYFPDIDSRGGYWDNSCSLHAADY